MRAVVQRVHKARVQVDEQVVGQIDRGLLVYLGVGKADDLSDLEYIVDKICNLRVFEDDGGRMNLSVNEIGGGVLLISQFTLYGNCRKGRRPSFDAAGDPDTARRLYEQAAEMIRTRGLTVATGVFAAHMHIDSVNDGPVTLLLDSEKTF